MALRKRDRQTFTSTYDSRANGVAERWISLIKTKATALLASKYMPTAFWCYAVAWVARCYDQRVLVQKPHKNLPEVGQLLLVRVIEITNFKNKEPWVSWPVTYPEIANGVILLSAQNHAIQESYAAHVAPATFCGKVVGSFDEMPGIRIKIVYVNDKGEDCVGGSTSSTHGMKSRVTY